MSSEYSELVAFRNGLQAMADDMPRIMEELLVGEGVFAVKQAVNICEAEKIDNTSFYKENFHADEQAQRSGKTYRIAFYNNADYAKHLEYGFRSHFVPGHWEGDTFVYDRNDPEGGMYVGPYKGFVRGHFVHRRAVKRTQTTQDARLRRKLEKILKRYAGGGRQA